MRAVSWLSNLRGPLSPKLEAGIPETEVEGPRGVGRGLLVPGALVAIQLLTSTKSDKHHCQKSHPSSLGHLGREEGNFPDLTGERFGRDRGRDPYFLENIP